MPFSPPLLYSRCLECDGWNVAAMLFAENEDKLKFDRE